MSAMTYLWRHQSGVYYFRRAVPDDLQAIIGKTMVKHSLRTKELAEAKRKAHPIAMQTEADFQAARERSSAPLRTDLTGAERAHLVAAYLHHRLAEDEAARVEGSKEEDDFYKTLEGQVEANGGTAEFTEEGATAAVGLSVRAYDKTANALEILLPGLREKLARGDSSIIADDVDAVLEVSGINLDRASPAYRRLSYDFLQTAVRATEAIAKRHEGQVIDTPTPPTPLTANRAA